MTESASGVLTHPTENMYNLKIISSSVRPGRKGPVIAEWITEKARSIEKFNVEFLDLGVINLPMMNEAAHPSLKKYEHAHTKQWSAKLRNRMHLFL